MESPRRPMLNGSDNTERAAAFSPYTAEEKLGLREQPTYSPASTPNINGIPKEYTEHPLLDSNVGEKAIPVRRYSRPWWKNSWNMAIEGRIWPRVVYGSTFLIIMAVWLGAMIGFAVDETNWTKNQEVELIHASGATGLENQGPLDGMIGLKGALKSFDPVARSLAVEWSGYYRTNSTADEQALASAESGFYYPLNIYRDVSVVLYNFGASSAPLPPNGTTIATSPNGSGVFLRRLNSSVTTDDIKTVFPHFGQTFNYYYGAEGRKFASQYVFRVENASTPPIGVIGMHESDSIDTDISFGPKDPKASAFKQPQFGYPFDEWQGNIMFVATDAWSTSLYNIPGINAFPLAGAILADNTLNWRFTVATNASCGEALDRLYNDTQSGVLPNDNSQYLGDLIQIVYPCQLSVTINGERPRLVKFAAIMAVIVNWTSTLFIFVMTAETLLMRREYMLSGTDLLGINFTALFALPSVRLLLPGAPDFGIIIDLVGIIPNVIIISLCITAISIAKLHRKKTAKDHED